MGAVSRPHQLIDGSLVDRSPAVEEGHARGRRRRPLTADQRLLVAAQKGNRQAFAEVVEQHQAAVFAYLRARLIEPADAEDLCQEVFLRCYTRQACYVASGSPRGWLIGVARNVLREHIRAVTGRQEVAWTKLCLELESLVDGEVGLYDDVLGYLPQCLQSLGQSARHALELRYRGQLKLTEVGSHLRRSEGAVKLLMHRARQAVRRCIDRKVAQADHAR